MKYEVELKQVIHVKFSDEVSANKYFVGKDAEHAQMFFESESLSDVAEHLSYNFNLCRDCYEDGKWMKFVEGFDVFVRHDVWQGDYCTRQYISETEDYGAIILVEEQELEVDYTQEV